MKKILTILIAMAMVFSLFVGCENESEEAKATEAPEATAVPIVVKTAEPTATPEPTPEPTATPVPEPGTYDILAQYGVGDPISADADGLIGGDVWPNNRDREEVYWCGILGTGYDQNNPDVEASSRDVYETELSNGEKGYVIRFANDGEGPGYVGAGNYITNLDTILEGGHTYKVTVVAKVTGSTAYRNHEVDAELREYWVYCYGDKLGRDINGVKVQPTEEWQTIEYVFTTVDDFSSLYNGVSYLAVLSDPDSPFMYQGFEVLIESVTIYEMIEK